MTTAANTSRWRGVRSAAIVARTSPRSSRNWTTRPGSRAPPSMNRSQASLSTATDRLRHDSRRSAADIWYTANFQAQVVNRLAPRYVSSLSRIITAASLAACWPSSSRSAAMCAGSEARRRAASCRAARTRNACSSATAWSRTAPSDRRPASQALDSGSTPTGCHAVRTAPASRRFRRMPAPGCRPSARAVAEQAPRPVLPRLGKPRRIEKTSRKIVVAVIGPFHHADRHAVARRRDHRDRVTGSDLALPDDPEVGARTGGRGEPPGKARIAHADAELVARDPRLDDLQDRRPDLPRLTDDRRGQIETRRRQVLAERAGPYRVAQLIGPPREILGR